MIEDKEKVGDNMKDWKKILDNSNDLKKLQGQNGNYNYDEYMLGLYNGMEIIISMFEEREPNFKDGKEVKFTHSKLDKVIQVLEDKKQKLSKLRGINFECQLHNAKSDAKEELIEEILNLIKE